ADRPQRRGLARAVRSEEPEDLALVRLERDAAQHLVRPQILFEAIDLDRHLGHFFLVARLVAVDVGLPPLAAALAAFLTGVRVGLAGAFGLAGVAALTGDAALTGTSAFAGDAALIGSSAAAGSADATPTELDSVRWQLSHVTMLRTRVPSWCSSRRRFRGRPQNEQ